METFDYQIIANCLAGKGQAEEKLESLKNFLDFHKKTHTSVEIRKFTPISQIPPDGNIKIEKGIICIGGDGTVSETIGFMVKRNWDLPIFVIPTGTANFLANSINVGPKVEYERILKGKVVEYDLGICEYDGKKDFFLVGIGLGFEQRFLTLAKEKNKKRFGRLTYILAAFLELFRLKPQPYFLELNGKKLRLTSTMIIILNLNPKFIKFLPVFPEKDIKFNDGLLDLFYAKHKNFFLSFLGILLFHLIGRINFGLIERVKTNQLSLGSPLNQKIQIDGEVKGSLPFKISILPRGVKFLI